MKIKPWIEALRLRTLPVSVAGVLAGCAVALAYGCFIWQAALLCLLFALLAQIVSNLANEYFDFKNGIDKKGRQGFRRGVTEGDLSPQSMKRLMLVLTAIDCAIGCCLIHWGGLWLIPVGIIIVIAAYSYSAGPWPLSHHGLGDELVIIFYGVVPVTLTAFMQCGDWGGGPAANHIGPMWQMALLTSIGAGLLANNVLTVNNVRDVRDDKKAGKRTKAVIFGVKTMKISYIAFYVIGAALLVFAFHKTLPSWSWIGYVVVTVWYVILMEALFVYDGQKLNKVLKYTSIMLLLIILWTLVCVVTSHNNIIPDHTSTCFLNNFISINDYIL